MNVFPNPVNDVLNLEITSELTGTFETRIYNLFGQTIQINQVDLITGENTEVINVNDFPKGSYLFQVTDGEKMMSRKFMKL